ncbi:MAG: hypothetical protein DRN26_01575 [Thermoplasmata archaeon]|nr:MAG: hypothetical protein DRN26_01575 [Thermoplasmata archaeon]
MSFLGMMKKILVAVLYFLKSLPLSVWHKIGEMFKRIVTWLYKRLNDNGNDQEKQTEDEQNDWKKHVNTGENSTDGGSRGKMKIVDVRRKMYKNPDPNRRYKIRKLNKIKKLVLHCDDLDWDLWDIARYDVTPNPNHHISPKGLPGFSYHHFIEKDGTIFYCETVTKITWHVAAHNTSSIGICIRYRATNNKNPPPVKQIDAVIELMTRLCLILGISPDNIYGHRELPGTGYVIINGRKRYRKSCPGWLVNLDKLRYTISIEAQKTLKQQGYYKGPIDGIFGRKSRKALKKYSKDAKRRR